MLTEIRRPVKPRILIADDEPKWLRVLSLYLSRHHCEVDTALNGQEAIERIELQRPDVIIADITMPDMDGYELCRRLRRNTTTRAIPFIFLTGRDHETERLKGSRVGADEYLTKPCSLERVMQSVDTAIERIEHAKQLSIERIGLSGRIDDIDLLDLIQALELEQRTGALILSHGERTGTLYLKDGAIAEADIRSPAREEPLFRLLGWKTGRYVFVPHAVPQAAPITASMAHVLFDDLQLLKDHETRLADQLPDPSGFTQSAPDDSPIGRLVTLLESVARQAAGPQIEPGKPCVLRVLIVGTATAAVSKLIEDLVRDLSPARWAALELREHHRSAPQEVGRVRLSARTTVHLIAMRGERRFWSVWERCLPGSVGAIVVISGSSETERGHVRSFLSARDLIDPSMPVVAATPKMESEPDETLGSRDRSHGGASPFPKAGVIPGSLADQAVRLRLVSRLLELRLAVDSH